MAAKTLFQYTIFSLLLVSKPSEVFPADTQFEPHSASRETPHAIDLDLDNREYLEILKNHMRDLGSDSLRINELGPPNTRMSLSREIQIGLRNLDWLNLINSKLPEGQKISFSSKNSRKGIPIDKPYKYNEAIINTRLEQSLTEMPEIMRDILLGNKNLTDTVPIPLVDYVKHGGNINKIMQMAIRFDGIIKKYKQWYISNRSRDVRGIHFLLKWKNLESDLSHFQNLSRETQDLLEGHLLNICYNTTENLRPCKNEFNNLKLQGALELFFDRYKTRSKQIYDSFFAIRNPRSDINWSGDDEHRAFIPFVRPNGENSSTIEEFIQSNIEEEWSWNGWHLNLVFNGSKNINPEIRFLPKITPNVDRIGGNIISMNSDAPLTEYSVQWTIRHEFGHVLGFPDCYLEFFDTDENAVISYQIDTSDLMCSRAGDFNQRIFNQLKLTYFKLLR